jgi:CheY-like chemotaxis protein/HPt (histidine-containing phosphotransfer) domain-containing protein
VRSELGQGSTFWFTVPFRQAVVTATEVQPGGLRGRRVLVVDDNRVNREILDELLQQWGISVRVEESASRALEMLREAHTKGEPFELAVIDMQMPEMDGVALGRAVRNDPKLSAIDLVMLTSVGDEGDQGEARSLGLSAYLTKPLRASQLFDCLQNVFAGVASTPAPSESPIAIAPAADAPLVLLAEDNVVNQHVAVELLAALGFRAHVANNGREAFDAFRRERFACVLMDCQMPEMNGHECTEAIRRHEREAGLARTAILGLTAHALASDRDQALKSGMDDYLTKPVTAAALSAALDRWAAAGRESREKVAERGADLDLVDASIERSSALVRVFVDDLPARLTQLREALERSDAEALCRAAHKFKGSCLMMGLPALAHWCSALESESKRGDLSNAKAWVARIDAGARKAERELLMATDRGAMDQPRSQP